MKSNSKFNVLAAATRLTRIADKKATIPKYAYRGQDNKLPSADSGIGNATAKAIKVYTGSEMLGVCQLHKSNAVPVFRQEDILDIAKMRR